jgi:hypothetical protein
VRRGLVILIALALGALHVQSLAFHVHAASDRQEDRDHAHGTAIHHHEAIDEALHLDEAESSAGSGVITIAVPAATTPSELLVSAEFTEAPRLPELQLLGDARTIDVRSHGPPQLPEAFLRGPPTSIPS